MSRPYGERLNVPQCFQALVNETDRRSAQGVVVREICQSLLGH